MFRRFARTTIGNTAFEQIKVVLAHADCQNIFRLQSPQRVFNHKEHKGHKGGLKD